MKCRNSTTVEDGVPLTHSKKHQDPKIAQYQKVLNAWEASDFKTFQKNFCSDIFSHMYSGYSDLRLLDLIVYESPCKIKYLEKALEFMPDVNEKNPKLGHTAAQFAIAASNFGAFWLLFQAGADPNIQDKDGDTILHYIVQGYKSNRDNFLDFLQKLLSLPNIAVNIPNLKGKTVIAEAACKANTEIIYELLKLGPVIDLDTFRDQKKNQTAREIILNKSKLKEKVNLPDCWQPDPLKGITDYRYRLFYFLTDVNSKKNKHGKLFRKTLTEALAIDTISKTELFKCVDAEGRTYLQRSAELSKTKAMKALLENGADINYAPPGSEPPIYYAALTQNLDGFSYLLENEQIQINPNCTGETLLHVLVKNRGSANLQNSALKKFLRRNIVDINAKDITGRTALHLAVTNANEKTIFELLDNGASLDIQDNVGTTPFSHLSAKTYENYLNTKITVNDEVAQDLNYTIFFDYKFLSNKQGTEHIHDISTSHLKQMLNSKDHEKLLAHPVIAAIIFYKWKKIRWLFYLYLFLSSLFCVMLTALIHLGPFVSRNETCALSYPSLVNATSLVLLEWYALIYLTIRGISEAIDLYSEPQLYLKATENYLQVSLIILSFVCISFDCPLNPENWEPCRSVSAFTVLFAWLELFFIIGKHPNTTFFIDMFRRASWFLLQFFAVHTALILAFVFSFSVIFQNEQGPFDSVPKAFFKTLIMLTGEYDLSEIPFNSTPIVSHLLFILFLFLVAIVLFNLLIGLAVSATKPIEDDSFLYSCIAQVPIIDFMERVFFSDCYGLKKVLLKKPSRCKIPQEDQLHPKLLIFPNQNKVQIKTFLTSATSVTNYVGWMKFKNDFTIEISHTLNERILQDAQKIAAAKRQNLTTDEKIEKLQTKLEANQSALEAQLQQITMFLENVTKKQESIDNNDK